MKEKGFKVFTLQMLMLLVVWMTSQISAYATETGTVSGMSAKVYKSMNEDGAVVANVIRESEFIILSMETDSNGTEWYFISTDTGIEGYIKKEETYREETAEQDINQMEKQQIRFGQNVNIRRFPTIESEIVGRVPNNTVLEPLRVQENEAGEIWYQIEYEGISGYILESTVDIIETEQEDEPQENEQQGQENVSITEAVQRPSTQYEEMEYALPDVQEKNDVNDEVEEKEVAYNKTTRKAVSPIDNVVIILAFGMVCSLLPVIFMVNKIKRKRQKVTDKYKK